MADEHKTVKYHSLAAIPKTRFSTVAFLSIFQVGFIVCFAFFAKFDFDKKNEVPNLYSSN